MLQRSSGEEQKEDGFICMGSKGKGKTSYSTHHSGSKERGKGRQTELLADRKRYWTFNVACSLYRRWLAGSISLARCLIRIINRNSRRNGYCTSK